MRSTARNRSCVVRLLDPFQGVGPRRKSAETQQSAPFQRLLGPEIKDERSIAKDGAPERLRYRTIQEVNLIELESLYEYGFNLLFWL